jgi:hypothetical protein
MKNADKRRKQVSAEHIARLADKAQDVSRFFTNEGRMMPPIGSVSSLLIRVLANIKE